MIPISKIVTEIVDSSPFLKKAIQNDLINLSSLARKIKPDIEQISLKKVSNASVVMALKRYASRQKQQDKIYDKDFSKYYGEISVRNNLFEMTYSNSNTLHKKLLNLQASINPKDFFNFIRGSWQTTIIGSNSLESKIEKALSNESLENHIENLTAITIKLQNGHLDQPGIISHALNQLAWRGINIIEIVSTFEELTFIIKDDEIERAFSVLNDLKKNKFMIL
ncbi:MAG: hypothetical protein KatS3mg085_488 [Candidatus Dojkabacteria bacterium]|nr:MAG: hypothetical protein KatS3mg085_488 [Candidatus Dojkabacteria bacterium]